MKGYPSIKNVWPVAPITDLEIADAKCPALMLECAPGAVLPAYAIALLEAVPTQAAPEAISVEAPLCGDILFSGNPPFLIRERHLAFPSILLVSHQPARLPPIGQPVPWHPQLREQYSNRLAVLPSSSTSSPHAVQKSAPRCSSHESVIALYFGCTLLRM